MPQAKIKAKKQLSTERQLQKLPYHGAKLSSTPNRCLGSYDKRRTKQIPQQAKRPPYQPQHCHEAQVPGKVLFVISTPCLSRVRWFSSTRSRLRLAPSPRLRDVRFHPSVKALHPARATAKPCLL